MEIDPIAIKNLFGIEGLNVAWYGIIIAVGIVLGVMIAIWQAKKKGYTSELIFDMMILALPLAIIGARLYYVILDWDYFASDPIRIVQIWHGGIAIYGAVIGAVIGAFIIAKANKFPFGRLLDFGAPGLILGQAIGRWGNFINQEAFGAPVTDPALQFFPYAVHVGDARVAAAVPDFIGNNWFQATFFYESMWDLGIFIFLIWYATRAKHDGNVFAMYMIGYGLGRLWIEGVRINTLQAGGIPFSQLLSLILIVIGVVYILFMRKRNKPDVEYHGKYEIGWAEAHPEGNKQKKSKPEKKAEKVKMAADVKEEKADDAPDDEGTARQKPEEKGKAEDGKEDGAKE